MNEHHAVRELLPLAAADALTEAETERVRIHLRSCAACAAALEQWESLGQGLRRLPTPQAPAQLVARTRRQIAPAIAAHQAQRTERWGVAGVLLLTWAVTLLGWPVARAVSENLLAWLHWGFDATWFAAAAYVMLGWITTGISAALLAAAKLQNRSGATNDAEESVA